MKTELTVEESQELIDLGISPDNASMISWKLTENWARKSVIGDKVHLQNKPFEPLVMGFEKFDVKDVFNLTDILSILPKEIDGRDLGMEYDSEFEQWCVGYNGLHLESAPELIDALFVLLKYVTKNKVNG